MRLPTAALMMPPSWNGVVMRSLKNLILFSLFLSSFAQAVNIIWIEYDADEGKVKGQLEYFGAEDQGFKLVVEEGEDGSLLGRIVEIDDDEGDEEQEEAQSTQRSKHHLKKWERKKIKKEAVAQQRAAARAARAHEEEAAAHRNHEHDFEFELVETDRPVYFVVNNIRALVIGNIVEDAAAVPPAAAANANLTQTPAAAAAAAFTFFAAPMPFGGGSH